MEKSMENSGKAINPKSGNMRKETGPAMYVGVWILLLALTGLTVAAASINLDGGMVIVVCLAIAAVKSMLVLLFFMHLFFEKRLVIKLLIPIVIITLAIFIGLTYTDVIARQGGN
jgi:cytochrome c oxidase subunit 4